MASKPEPSPPPAGDAGSPQPDGPAEEKAVLQPPEPGGVGDLFEDMIDAVRLLFRLPRTHRHQDQYLGTCKAAVELAKTKAVTSDINRGYQKAVGTPKNQPSLRADAARIVRMELDAFPLAIEVHEAEEKAGTAKPGAVSRLRAEAKTILRSVQDVFELSDVGRYAIVVLIEALELVDEH